MALLFTIPLLLLTLAAAGYLVADIAYEHGYDDACDDWRNTTLYREAGDVIDAEVVDVTDIWPAWAGANAEQSGGYPPSMN